MHFLEPQITTKNNTMSQFRRDLKYMDISNCMTVINYWNEDHKAKQVQL